MLTIFFFRVRNVADCNSMKVQRAMNQAEAVTIKDREVYAGDIDRVDDDCSSLELQGCTADDWRIVFEAVARKRRLVRLAVRNCAVDDTVLLYKFGRLVSLTHLVLTDTNVTNHGVFALLELNNLRYL